MVGVSGCERSSRHLSYLAAWLYLCAWIVALSMSSVPTAIRSVTAAVAVGAALFIVRVLVAPRPTRAPLTPSD